MKASLPRPIDSGLVIVEYGIRRGAVRHEAEVGVLGTGRPTGYNSRPTTPDCRGRYQFSGRPLAHPVRRTREPCWRRGTGHPPPRTLVSYGRIGIRDGHNLLFQDTDRKPVFYNGRPPLAGEADDWVVKVERSGSINCRLSYIEGQDAQLGWQLRQSGETEDVRVSQGTVTMRAEIGSGRLYTAYMTDESFITNAVSKLFGEHMGKLYSQRYGLEFVGLRIGWITVEDDPTTMRGTPAEDYMRAMFLSHRDCLQAHRRALEVDARYLLAYAVSGNGRRVFDLEATSRDLGYVPKDDAENYFRRLEG